MAGFFDFMANPTRFQAIARPVRASCFFISVICFLYGLYLSLFASPADYQQGEAVRIMYVHVPSAWMALFVYSSIAAASLIGLINGHIVAFIYAKSVAPIGAVFTLICLVIISGHLPECFLHCSFINFKN
mgnify:CR=1 FL=1